MNNVHEELIERIKREHLKAIKFLALAERAVTDKERLEHLDSARKYSERVASGIRCYLVMTGHANEDGDLDRSTL